jgi:hypothetical protein
MYMTAFVADVSLNNRKLEILLLKSRLGFDNSRIARQEKARRGQAKAKSPPLKKPR